MSDKLEFIEQNKTNPDKSFDDLPGIIICWYNISIALYHVF